VGELVEGDDGLPVEEVGVWAKDKHQSLSRYVDISRGVRSKWLDPGKPGATYIDLFCGPGRAKVRRTGEFVDGSCVAAWNASLNGGTPFSEVIIADADDERRDLAAQRLRRLKAPVIEVGGDAANSIHAVMSRLKPQGLHFAFLDPYNLASFDFCVMQELAKLKYIDILVHVSKMDLQRNLGINVKAQQSAFDTFAPGWRSAVDLRQSQPAIRRDVFSFWKQKVANLGIGASTDMELITGSRGQHLYWLTLVARHQLAHVFWKVASNKSKQGSLF
jgi:three-Cys-motif partner protein